LKQTIGMRQKALRKAEIEECQVLGLARVAQGCSWRKLKCKDWLAVKASKWQTELTA